jgi:hypothetical protein
MNGTNPLVLDLMEVVQLGYVYSYAGTDNTLTFSVQGVHPIQKRQRFFWKHMFGGWHTGRTHPPIVFNPSLKAKKCYATTLKKEMDDLDLTTFLPYFSATEKVTWICR